MNQPRKFDVVKGNNIAPTDGAVLGGLQGIKNRLQSSTHNVQLTALNSALTFGDAGLDLIIEVLHNYPAKIKLSAYRLLKEQDNIKAKQAVAQVNPYAYLEHIHTFTGFSKINSLAISPDNQNLVCGASLNYHNSTTEIWNLQTGKQPFSFIHRHCQEINSVAITPDGEKMVCAADDYQQATINICSMKDGSLLRNYQAPYTIYSLAIHPDGESFISAGLNKTISVWKFQQAKVINTINIDTSVSYAICITPSGKTLISGSSDGSIKVIDLKTQKQTWSFGRHSHHIRSLAISPDGKTLVSGSDQRIKVWDIKTGQQIFSFYGHADWVRAIVFSPLGKTLLTAGDQYIKVWDISTGKKVYAFQAHAAPIRALAISNDGHTVASGSADGVIHVWRLS